jgi:hypothetical protein
VFKPLAVPAKLVPSLTSEKALRAACKRYGLPLEGRKKVSAVSTGCDLDSWQGCEPGQVLQRVL